MSKERTNHAAEVLPDAEMRALGFTDYREGYWYYVTEVGRDTTLNIFIHKETGAYTEYVLNEFLGQPEYYGLMKEPFRTKIHDNIEAALAKLRRAGLGLAVNHAAYGWEDA